MKHFIFSLAMVALALTLFTVSPRAYAGEEPICGNGILEKGEECDGELWECDQCPVAVDFVDIPEEEKKLPEDPPPHEDPPVAKEPPAAEDPPVLEQVPAQAPLEISGSKLFGCSLAPVTSGAELFSGLEFLIVGVTAWTFTRKRRR